MTALVVDASVAVKWFLPEIHSQAAERVLICGEKLSAPDPIWAEVGNALYKRVIRKEITLEEASAILKDFLRFPLLTYASKSLLDAAWAFAGRFSLSVYDSLYLALAAGLNCSLVTADKKFYDAMQKKSLGPKLVWVEDVK